MGILRYSAGGSSPIIRGTVVVTSAGATGTGATDDAAALNAILATAAGKKVIFPAGTYRVDSPLSVTASDVEIELQAGAIIDGGNIATGGSVLSVQGTLNAATTTISGSAGVGSTSVTVASAAAFAAGDLVRITSAEVFNSERPGQYFRGEWLRVATASGTTVTFTSGLVDTYNTSTYTVTLRKTVPVERFRLAGAGVIRGGGAGSESFGLRAVAAVDLAVEGITVEDCEQIGIYASDTVGYQVIGTKVHGSDMDALGYGIKANGCEQVAFVGNVIERCRHGLDVDSGSGSTPCRNVVYTGTTVRNCTSSGISTHGGAEGVAIQGNTVLSCGGGIVIRSPKTLVVGNTIIGGKTAGQSSETYGHGIWVADAATNGVSPAGTDLLVANNDIHIAAGYTTERFSGIAVSCPLIRGRITGNTMTGFSGHGIQLDGRGHRDSVVSGNVIDCSAQPGTPGTSTWHGIYVSQHAQAATGDRPDCLTIESNIIRSPLYSGIRITGGFDSASRAGGIVARGNTVRSYGKNGIEMSAGYFGRSVLVSGNVFPDATALGTGTTVTDPIYYVSAQFLTNPTLANNVVG